MTSEETKKPLNKTVIQLGLVSFFADVASEMLYPVTPIFLTAVLGASMSSLGVIEGVAEGVASLLKTFSGYWSDRISRRKPFIVIGYLLGAIAKPMIGISTHWLGVLGARSLDRTGKGLRSAPRDALIADSVSAEQRGAAYGWHRGMDTLGAALGPLLAILFLQKNPEQLRTLYFWALLPGLISVALLFWVRESQRPQVAKTENKISMRSMLGLWSQLNFSFKQYLFSWGVFSLVNSSDVFLLMKVKQTGASTAQVILYYCLYNLVYALSSPFLGRLSDHWPRKRIMTCGLIAFSAVYFGFTQASLPWHFWSLFIVYGFYMGATDGVGKALAVDLVAKDLKATGLGLLGTVTGIATIMASTAAGFLWDHFGDTAPFWVASCGSLLAAVLLLGVRGHDAQAS